MRYTIESHHEKKKKEDHQISNRNILVRKPKKIKRNKGSQNGNRRKRPIALLFF